MTTVCIICACLLTGNLLEVISASYQPSPSASPMEEELALEQPAVEDEVTEAEENEYDNASTLYDPIPTDLSFAQTVIEAPKDYYDPADQQGTLEYFDYTTKNYDQDEADENKYAVVYTPYNYDPENQYDIVYLMHGVYGYAEIYLGYPGAETSIKNVIDHMIEDGTIRPMIIVCMSYYDNNEQEINDNEDADITKAFGAEFQNDLMPQVESHYSTYAVTTDKAGLKASRDHRIFAGFSMGGVTTWYAFAQSLDYCRYFFPMSGMLYWGPDYPETTSRKDQWSGQYLANALKIQGYSRDDFFIYMATGGYDEAKPFLEAQIRSMKHQNHIFVFGDPFKRGVNCTYIYSEYEDHTWLAVLQYLYNGLPVLSRKITERSAA